MVQIFEIFLIDIIILTENANSPLGDSRSNCRRHLLQREVEQVAEEVILLVFGERLVRSHGMERGVLGFLVAQNQHANSHDCVRQQGADAHHVNELLQVEHHRHHP